MPTFKPIRKPGGMQPSNASPDLQAIRRVIASPAAPLAENVRKRAERAFGWSFENVAVHSGPEAAQTAQSIGARAFTLGRHVVVGEDVMPGRMSVPLAHELAHVVQTRGAEPSGDVKLSAASSPAERSASEAGNRVAAGGHSGHIETAAPVLYRDSKTTIPVVKKSIAAKGHDEITELAKLIPNSGTGKAKYKEVTINGTKHVFNLNFTLVQQSTFITSLTGQNAVTGEAISKQGAPPSETVTHDIAVVFASGIIGDPVETLYHELVHARILIDKTLPQEQHSDTYGRYAQLLEMANDPALLTVTSTTAKKKGVISAIQSLRAGIASVAGFNASLVGKTATTDDAIYEFLINEKFTNLESSSVVTGKALSSEKIASRYARAVRGMFEKGLQGPASQDYQNSKIHDLADEREEALRKALLELYQALDAQQAQIAAAKKNGVPSASKTPHRPTLEDALRDPMLSPPLDMQGRSLPMH